MYGIVNKAIEELVIANFGEEKWETIKANSDIDVDYFISNEPYDDDITYKLAGAVSQEMQMTVADVLTAFGEWWILKTSKEKYGSLLSTGGESLRAFLIHLPDFHTRVMLMYPKLTPPEFKITHIEANSVQVHYFSKREGLQEFVRGLLQGLSKLYETETQIELLQTRDEGSSHEIFKVTWI
jgi:Haem-NO-binding